jgi:hypothetical protein
MTRPRAAWWLLAVVGWVLGACSGDDSSPPGAGGSSASGGAGGSSQTGGAGGSTTGGGAGTGGTAGSGGSGGGDTDAGSAGKAGAAGAPGDGSTGGEPGKCLAAGTYTVVNDGSNGYLIAGGSLNTAITLCRGTTYTFAINAPFHPFYIRDGQVEYTAGITGSRITTGNLVFAVPMNAPAMLFYQCAAHDWMTGPILTVD